MDDEKSTSSQIFYLEIQIKSLISLKKLTVGKILFFASREVSPIWTRYFILGSGAFL